MKPKFFATPAAFRRWLEKNHDKQSELIVGFYKKDSGRPSITWPESVDQALCFGWIDGIRRRIDDVSYSIRFTPRRPGSIWSKINLDRAKELVDSGLMHPAGLLVFEGRDRKKSGVYSFENRPRELSPELEKRFRAHREAWTFFNEQPPGYRRLAVWFVMSAKRDETRERRLATLIEVSAKRRRL